MNKMNEQDDKQKYVKIYCLRGYVNNKLWDVAYVSIT